MRRLIHFMAIALALMLPSMVCAEPDVGQKTDSKYASTDTLNLTGGDEFTAAATIDITWTIHSEGIQLNIRLPDGQQVTQNIANDIANRAQPLLLRSPKMDTTNVDYTSATCGGHPVLSGKGTIGRHHLNC